MTLLTVVNALGELVMANEISSMQTLTSYDWVAKENPGSADADVVGISEQDYSQGVQRVKLTFDDGSSVIQTRRWRDERTHTDWLDLYSGNLTESLTGIERGSFLLKEDKCEPFKTGTDLEIFMRGVYENDVAAEVPYGGTVEAPGLEAFLTEDEVGARTQQYLDEHNLAVNENNEIVQHHTPEEIRDLALEFRGIDINVKDYMAAVAGKFKAITDGFRAYSANAVRVKNFRYDSIKTRKLAGNLQRIPYSVLVDLGVYVVPGQCVTYLSIIDALEQAGKASVAAIRGDLSSFVTAVGVLVNNPSQLASARKILGTPNYTLDKPKTTLSACFNTSNKTQVGYATVIERNDDWNLIRTRLDALLDLFDSCQPKEVKEIVDSVSSNLDNIQRTVANGTEIAGKANMEVLADWCFHCAQIVEFYAAYTNVLRTLLVAVEDSVEKITKVTKSY